MRWITVLLVPVLAATACGSDGDGTDASETAPSPIAEFLGEEAGPPDDETFRQEILDEEQARQEAIAACMQEEGFDYVAYVPDGDAFFGAGDGDVAWGSEEWVARYGFGITTLWFTQEEVGPGLTGSDDSGFDELMAEDPNQQIFEGLSESEQDAYQVALYGDLGQQGVVDQTMDDEEAEAQREEIALEPAGCQGEAFADSASFDFYRDFGDELEELYQRVESDPRIIEAMQDVSECVAGQGLEFTSMDDVRARFDEHLEAIDAAVVHPGQDLTEDEYNSMTDEELQEVFGQPRVIPEEQLAELADLQASEIELAVAVDECGGGFDDQDALYDEIAAEYEQEFLTEHQEELAGYRRSS
jgi:hypothetical protein